MNTNIIYVLIIGMAFLFSGCATTVETTMSKSWEKEVAFEEEANLQNTQMHLTKGGETVTLVSPSGIETLDSQGSSVYEAGRENLFSPFISASISTTRGSEELTKKIAYLYLPHRYGLLEFNYSLSAESVTMIDLDNSEISWINDDLKWSLERYQVLARSLANGLGFTGGAAVDAASEMALPETFVENMTTVVPELDAILFKTLEGLKLISLENGEVLWNNEEVKGGITKMFYDPETNSLIVVNNDSDSFKLEGLQFNKQIARIDAEDGATIWTNNYDGDIREKVDGIGVWADRVADIRLLDDAVMINFLNVEMYDFETGDKLWQTSEGSNRMLDLVAAEAQIMNQFAFPVISGKNIYRVGFENVGLTGVDIIIEAYDLYSGERHWKSDKLSRSKPVNDIKVFDDHLIVSMGSSEGVVALDLTNGKRVWQYEEFGRRGVTQKMYSSQDGVIAAGSDAITLLNSQTGDVIYKIDTKKDGIGGIQDLLLNDAGIAVSGDTGFAMYDATNGRQIKKIATPTGGMILPGKSNMLITPKPNYSAAKYPVDGAFYLLNPGEGKLFGTLGTDKNRKSWQINDDFTSIYVLTGNKVEKYEMK